jgi:hypothetical protein
MLLKLVLLACKHVDLRLKLHQEALLRQALDDFNDHVRIGVEVANQAGVLVVVAKQLAVVSLDYLCFVVEECSFFVANMH